MSSQLLPQEKPPPHHLPLFFIGGIQNIFSGLPLYWWRGDLVLFKKWRQRPPRARGGSSEGTKSSFFPPVLKRGAGGPNSSGVGELNKKRLSQHKKKTALPFHIDRRGMNSFLPFPTPARNPAGALKVRPNFITFCAPLTSSMRMIHWIHCNTTNNGASA